MGEYEASVEMWDQARADAAEARCVEFLDEHDTACVCQQSPGGLARGPVPFAGTQNECESSQGTCTKGDTTADTAPDGGVMTFQVCASTGGFFQTTAHYRHECQKVPPGLACFREERGDAEHLSAPRIPWCEATLRPHPLLLQTAI